VASCISCWFGTEVLFRAAHERALEPLTRAGSPRARAMNASTLTLLLEGRGVSLPSP